MSKLTDVGGQPGGEAIRDFLMVGHNEDGSNMGGAGDATQLQSRPVTSAAPSVPQTLTWTNASIWAPVSGDFNVCAYGGVGDGTVGAVTGTDNTAAIAHAIGGAGTAPVAVPPGYFRTTVAASTLSGPFNGPGQVITTEAGPAYNARGKTFNQVTTQPANPSVVTGSFSPFRYGALATAFNGDLTHTQYAIEHRVTGANTLGTVAQTSGLQCPSGYAGGAGTMTLASSTTAAGFAAGGGSCYRINSSTGAFTGPFTYSAASGSTLTTTDATFPALSAGDSVTLNSIPYLAISEASPFLVYLNNNSGRSGVASTGRTGIGAFAVKLTADTSAGGDTALFTIDGKAYGVTGGATRWDQNSSVGMVAASWIAAATGVFLDVSEHQMLSSTFDCTAIGMIRNMTRNVADVNSLGTFWQGIRLNSNGSQAVDTGIGLMGAGGYMVGLDMASATLTSSGTYIGAAVTLATDQRIYLNAVGTADSGSAGSTSPPATFYRRPSSTGTEWIDYHGSAMRFVVGSSALLTLATAGSVLNGAGGFSITGGALNMNTHKIIGVVAGTTANDAATLSNSLDQFTSATGNYSMGSHKITGLALGTAGTSDAASCLQAVSDFATATGTVNMGSNKILSVADGAALNDAINVGQRVDPLAQAAGYIQWNYNPQTISSTNTTTAGTVYLTAIWLPPGKTITNIVLMPTIAAAGSAPTNFYVGIAGPTGTMLKQSNDVKASVLSANTPLALALNGTYLTSSSDSSTGLYYIVILQVGSWGSTQPSFARSAGSASVAAALGANPRMFATGATTSQTALPANNSGIAGGLTTSAAAGFFAGVT